MTNYNSAYIERGIWELWHDKDWSDFEDKFYRDQVQKFVLDKTKENILLYGENGTGKSMLMNLAMKDLLHQGHEVYVIDFRHLINEYTKNWRGEGKLGRLMMSDYLAIDDFGKEFNSGGSGVSKELAITTIDYVLRYRFQRRLPTWMTFNMYLEDVKLCYNEHIASLLKRSSIALAFYGKDYGDKLFKQITK